MSGSSEGSFMTPPPMMILSGESVQITFTSPSAKYSASSSHGRSSVICSGGRPRRAPAVLAERCGVDVRVEGDGKVEGGAERGDDLRAGPAGLRRRRDPPPRG